MYNTAGVPPVSSVASVTSLPTPATPGIMSAAMYPAGTSRIFITAMSRWLNVSELEALLDPDSTPLTISTQPPPYPPPSGTLILYDRAQTRNYKDDGYEWIKKRNSPKVREDHVKLRVGGRYRVAGCYVHSSTNQSFHRRAYHLLDPETGTALHPPNASSAAQQAAQAAAAQSGSASVVSQDGNCTVGTSSYGTANNKRGGGRSLVLVHYLDTEMAALHSANLDDSSSQGSGSRSSRRRGRRRRTGEAATVITNPQQAAAVQAQAAQVAQFQQQQAMAQLLQASMRGQNVAGLSPQQIQQLAAAQFAMNQSQQLQSQLQAQQQAAASASVAGVAGSPDRAVSELMAAAATPGGASVVSAPGILQAQVPFVAAAAPQTLGSPATVGSMPPPQAVPLGMVANPNAGSFVGGVPGIPAPVAATTTSVASGTPAAAAPHFVNGVPVPAAAPAATPPVAAPAGYTAASLEPRPIGAQDLRNEEQLHKLQARLHHQDRQQARSIPDGGGGSSPSPVLGAGGPAVAARAAGANRQQLNRGLSSGAMDDDTLDILWGMVVEEGGGATAAGSGSSSAIPDADGGLETAEALAGMLENDDKIGDMLEDAEGLLVGAGDLGSDFDSDIANEAVAEVLSQAGGRKRSAEAAYVSAGASGAGENDLAAAVQTEDEEQKMAAIAASAVSAFEQELRDARNAARAAGTPPGTSPAIAAAPGSSPSPAGNPSLQSQLSALQQRQGALQEQQREAERQFQLAQHQQLQAQLQQRGTLNPTQLAQATDTLEQAMRSQTMHSVGASAPVAANIAAAVAPVAANPAPASQAESSMSEEMLSGEPLPDLLDFTPEMTDLPVPAQGAPKVMLSCSAPLPGIPSADGRIFQWHSLAAFVSASVNAADGSILDIHKLDLSPVRPINPYTLKSSIPITARTPGERRIIVIAVQLYAGTDPICEGVAAGVAAALQQAWAIAVKSDGTDTVPTLAKKPVFTNVTDLASGQIKLLTQFSDDLFVFRNKAG